MGTVVGSVSVAASDLASEQMQVDDQFVQESKESAASGAKAGEEEKAAPASEEKAAPAKKDGNKEEKKEGEEKEAKKEPEPTEEILNNPCRVLPAQKAYISFPKEIDGVPARYTPLI